jgi:hypothetical protein
MGDSVTEFFDELQRRQARRSQALQAERRSLAKQKLAVLSLAVATATAAVCLLLYGLGRAVIDPSLGTAGFAALAGVGTGLASGGFGWLARYMRDRQSGLDAQESRDAQQQYLMVCTLLIENPALRDETTARIAALAASCLYDSSESNPITRRRSHENAPQPSTE